MAEIDDIKQVTKEIVLFGKPRTLKFGMSALEKIEAVFGSLKNMGTEVSEKPGTNIPILIMCFLKNTGNEDITPENIVDELDEHFSIVDLKNMISELVKSATSEAKAESKNPQ